MVLDAISLNIQYHKVRIKGKVEQSSEWGSAPSIKLNVEKIAFGSPSTKVASFAYISKYKPIYL